MTGASPVRSPVQSLLDSLHARYSGHRDGAVADYIPELSKADPELFGIAVATADGFLYESGDSRHEFTIQSISKPFVYGLALDDHGVERMLGKVGVEPSGDAFNAISLHKATGRPMRIDQDVYESESRTGHRNLAIGHLLRNFDVLEDDPTAAVDAYFQQCSIAVRCVDLALMAATLANQGVNPVTGVRAIRVYEDLSRIWQLHQFNPPYCPQSSRRLAYTAADRSSTRSRPVAARGCLREHGGRIRVVEVQGNLAFATTESIVREITAQPDESRTVIIDFHHDTAVNQAAAMLLAAVAADLGRAGRTTFFTRTRRLPALREHVAACSPDTAAVDRLFRFASTDQALEWCEDELLRELLAEPPATIGDLRSFEIAAELADEELEVPGRLLVRRHYSPGDVIIRDGEEPTNLFLVIKGLVGVWLGEPGKGSRVAGDEAATGKPPRRRALPPAAVSGGHRPRGTVRRRCPPAARRGGRGRPPSPSRRDPPPPAARGGA